MQANHTASRYLSPEQDNLQMLLTNSFEDKSRESTRQEKYQDIFRYKTQLRRQNHNLKRQIETTKQQILSKALGIYFQEIKQLSDYNQVLRQKHRKVAQKKKPKFQNLCLNEGMHTPRSRKSLVNIYEPDRKGCETDRSPCLQKQNIEGRKSLNFKNNGNLNPKQFNGRQSLKFSDMRRADVGQMTEKKRNFHEIPLGDSTFMNISMYSGYNSQQGSLKNSVYRKSQKKQTKKPIQSIFTKFVNTLLEQQKQKHQIIQNMITQNNPHRKNQDYCQLAQLEEQLLVTNQNIQKMEIMLENYECQIKQMQLNIQCVSTMTNDIAKVKNSFLVIKQKCRNIHLLKNQYQIKDNRLKQLKADHLDKQKLFQAPQSIKLLLKVFGVDESQSSNPKKCKNVLKSIVAGKLQKPIKRKVKVKQLLDNMREGRKKFKELMSIYKGKIGKIQRKIESLKFYEKKS